VDLSTRYMGLELANPVVASASPLNADLDNIRRLEDAGVAAIVLPSLFEEEIRAEALRYERLTGAVTESFAEALTYFPEHGITHGGTTRYLDLAQRAVEAVDAPIIGSLNDTTPEGWITYAREIEEAGAHGLELNVYFLPTDLSLSGRAVEQRYPDVLAAVRETVTIPIAVKLSPYLSAPGHVAMELARGGADALVLFNRLYQPDIDIVRLQLRNDLELSRHEEIRLPLLWIAVLAGRVRASLAASTGVESWEEIVKYLMAGADVVMTTSALLRHGVGFVGDLLAGLRAWLSARGIHSVDRIRGLLSRQRLGLTEAFERASYLEILSWPRGGERS